MTNSSGYALEFLTIRSTLAMLLRALYRVGLDYCVLRSAEDFADIIVISKDQLISLIERNSPEALILDIAAWAAQRFFKPAAIFKPDFPPGDFALKNVFADSDQLQILLIERRRARVALLKEALYAGTPGLPGWWEAPMPFALREAGRLHVNHTAALMFGPDLKRLDVRNFLEKDEFMVTLEGNVSSCSVMFRRLEGDIFLLEDCTADIAAAEDIAWWAALGKAWLAKLDREGRLYRRYSAEEMETLPLEELEVLRSENAIYLCEWEGKTLGCLRLEKDEGSNSQEATLQEATPREPDLWDSSLSAPGGQRLSGEKFENELEEAEESEVKKKKIKEDRILKALGPQTMGLLTPSSHFAFAERCEEDEEEEDKKEGREKEELLENKREENEAEMEKSGAEEEEEKKRREEASWDKAEKTPKKLKEEEDVNA